MTSPLWTPSPEQAAATTLAQWMGEASKIAGRTLDSYDTFYEWSVSEPDAFWKLVWDKTSVVYHEPPRAILENGQKMPGARWFPGATLNYAENLLRHRGQGPALLAVWEGTPEAETWSHDDLYDAVARFQSYLRARGVGRGDRVAGFMPNRPEAIVAMLATTALGAIWSSCSPDFGFKGVMDRFGQITPKVLVCADGYRYNGKVFDTRPRIQEVAASIQSLEHVVVVPLLDLPRVPSPSDGPEIVSWDAACSTVSAEVTFVAVPFDHPLYILYSSGTTGVPKCIVHGHGGTLLQHAKEHLLHCDLRPDDTLFFFTTCGWMMWNWLVSALFVGSRIVLYEGSPGHPSLERLWELAERHEITHFGTSPKFLTACEKAGVDPSSRPLDALRCVLSTGAPLSIENFEWVYRSVKADVQLASISGGTDLISCFMLGSPISPVYPGEIQKRGLAMNVEAYDEQGTSVVGQKGELVCTAPFPSMPVGFWNDPEGERYHAAYFDVFPNIWRHGDYIEVTDRGGVIVYGRSDATLNPGGVRIGTAEIYRQVERLEEVTDSLVIGQNFDNDVRVLLFVVLRPEVTFDDGLVRKIAQQIRKNTTPRHVPARILQAPAIPRTISGKKVELAVTRLIHGDTVKNRDALANPASLDFFGTLDLTT